MFTDLKKTQNTYLSLSKAMENLQAEQPEQATINKAIERGYFIPEEDDYLWSLASRYLSIRHGFWGLINDMSSHFSDDIKNVQSLNDWRHFLLGYAASCQAVKMARLLVDELARHKLVQRKINEGSPPNHVPRKIFTHIFQSLSDTDNAIKMQYMMNFVEDNQAFIKTLEDDEYVGCIVKSLPQLEQTLHSSQLAFLKLRLKYLWHSLTRRGAVGKQITSFFILEKAGRVVAGIGDHENKRVTTDIVKQLTEILQPGDVIITRHDFVASNLFLPGYWPHAALYIGTEMERKKLGLQVVKSIEERWCGQISVLEAKSDGVLFRPLSETLAVDECIILRPQLSQKALVEGISRAIQHEGKGYNFDFDFFRSDQLVCTEVIFRAYDNLENIQFNLIERAGRLSLSAEDILDMALEGRGFDAVATFGFKGCETTVINDNSVLDRVKSTYKSI